jgi:hypothetical protein
MTSPHRIRIIVAMTLLLSGVAPIPVDADPPANTIADQLTEQQKHEVRSSLDQSLASIDANIERARQSNQPLLAEFASLSRDYIGLVRAMTLGEDEHGSAVPPPGDDEVIALIDRTQARIQVLRERHGASPALAPVLPHIDMMSRQLAANRMQILSRQALAGNAGLEPAQVQALFDRARNHLDEAERSIAGSPAEHELGERIAEARERLEQGELPAPADQADQAVPPEPAVRP